MRALAMTPPNGMPNDVTEMEVKLAAAMAAREAADAAQAVAVKKEDEVAKVAGVVSGVADLRQAAAQATETVIQALASLNTRKSS